MKESGIDWIGQIPEEWYLGKVKFFSKISAGATPDRNNIFFWNGDINWMSSGEVNQEVVTHTAETITTLALKRTSTKLLPIGTVMLALNGQGKTKGTAAVLAIETASNQSLASFIVDDARVNNIYLYYFLKANYSNIRGLKGEDRDGLNLQLVSNIIIPLLDIKEQKKIADFLDKKTSQLDKAKSLLEEQIQKLKDYRASLIYETVTKGLDKTVPMKDSGIDWIGQVPQGWGVKRLKDYVDFQTGTTPPQSIGVNQEGKGVSWFKPGDFSDESIDLTSAENYITSEVVNQQKLSVYPEKTILVVGIASIGKVGYSENHSYSNQQITALKVTGQIFPKYLAYLMFSSGQYIRETALYTIVPIINNQYLSSLKIVLPNRVVQETIVEYLDKKIGQINKMIVIKNEQIKNINKQRQTLIYEYVTGKRRV